MAMGMRPGLGMTLQNIAGGFLPKPPSYGTPPIMGPRDGIDEPIQFPQIDIAADPSMQPHVGKGPSKFGDILMKLGDLGDVISATQGNEAAIRNIEAKRQQQAYDQRQQQEEAQWSRREQWKRDHPEPTALERNLGTWQGWSLPQRQAYAEMQKAQQGDPDVVTTLPNGQLYAGPRSGLAQALMGQGAAAPAQPRRLGPVVDSIPGGPTQPASGGFPRP